MARRAKPWFRKSVQSWYVQKDGKQVHLGKSKAEAFQKFHELMAGESKDPIPATDTIANLAEAFLDWTMNNRAERTYDWYRDFCSDFVGFAGSNRRLSSVTPDLVEQWTKQKKYKGSTKRGAITALKRLFNWGVKYQHCRVNPIASIERPEATTREEILTDNEWDELLGHVRDEAFRDLLTFLWETGCRIQEARIIEPKHIDLDAGTVTLERVNSKGKKRRRVLYLNDVALEIVRRRIALTPTFQNRNGNAWTAFACNCRFERLKEKIGRKVCCYVIRHSYCTRALKNGVDPVTLAELMGHRDSQMISRVYQHLSKDTEHMRKKAAQAAQ